MNHHAIEQETISHDQNELQSTPLLSVARAIAKCLVKLMIKLNILIESTA